ncbi:hypothetical protein GCM10008022_27050 [Paenibacillus hunanensis]|uniref:Uncharacterized protein n=1 Tax=Paenibacillus hunanensis TaxID=539262 RepID=A0ABU1J2W4_9BACL|nr:hypothetical protein [Paenibacillus hunanensis]GGJ16379.1 hypothetical protein GCM10008022_27050 [Paenibacillus hunanensis]
MSIYWREIPPIEGEDARRLMERIQKNNEKRNMKLAAIMKQLHVHLDRDMNLNPSRKRL